MLRGIDQNRFSPDVDSKRVKSMEKVREDSVNGPFSLIHLHQWCIEPNPLHACWSGHSVSPFHHLPNRSRRSDIPGFKFVNEPVSFTIDQLGAPAAKCL